MTNDYEQAVTEYRAMPLETLLKLRFYGEYIPGPIEEVIIEKVRALESIKPCRCKIKQTIQPNERRSKRRSKRHCGKNA